MDKLIIASVEPILVDSGSTKNWLFVRITTEEGVDGWGECYTFPEREPAVRSMVAQLGAHIVGKDASEIRPFTQLAYRDFGGKRGSLELFSAASGIEQAMWDVLGRSLGQPVYRLLGGAFTNSVRVYANGWSMDSSLDRKSTDEVVEQAVRVVERGFTALKFDPFPGAWHDISRADEMSAVDCLREVRQAVGEDVDILIEGHRRLTPKIALRVAKKFEEYNPFWFEEPVAVDGLTTLAEIRRASLTPIVTGETLYGKEAFKSVFAYGAADIINPDVCACGGIVAMREIGAMADAHGVGIAPHNYNSMSVALAATLHAAAGMSNLVIVEYFVNAATVSEELSAGALPVENGFVKVPQGPGLGVELDLEVIARRPYRSFARRVFAHASEAKAHPAAPVGSAPDPVES